MILCDSSVIELLITLVTSDSSAEFSLDYFLKWCTLAAFCFFLVSFGFISNSSLLFLAVWFCYFDYLCDAGSFWIGEDLLFFLSTMLLYNFWIDTLEFLAVLNLISFARCFSCCSSSNCSRYFLFRNLWFNWVRLSICILKPLSAFAVILKFSVFF